MFSGKHESSVKGRLQLNRTAGGATDLRPGIAALVYTTN